MLDQTPEWRGAYRRESASQPCGHDSIVDTGGWEIVPGLQTSPNLAQLKDQALHRSVARQLLVAGSGLGVSAPPVDINRFRVAMNEPGELNALVDPFLTSPLLSRARQQALMFGRTLKAMKISEA